MKKERPVKVVPVMVIGLLLTAFIAQITWHALRPPATANASDLPDPPSLVTLKAISLGEEAALSKILMLWLQAFDYQEGMSIPFSELDYDKVISWLDSIMQLDERSHYPLLSAARVYSEVQDNVRRRKMLEFVHEKFLQDPDRRWQWLAHAVYVAKHRVKDYDLAYQYARALRMNTSRELVPDWARQMELFILEDMGEIEEAKILLGGLLESGVIKDRNELRFFEERLSKSEE